MGDEAGFADFVRAHTRSLFGTAYLLTGSGERAEELLQDTLAHLYPKWQRVAQSDAPLAYVRRALTNRFVSSTRTPASRAIAMWELPDAADPTDVAAVVSDRSALFHLLGTLPERQRAAVVLRYFHDQPDDEIATALGCRAATVRSLVSRGIGAMRERAVRADALGGGR